MRGAGEGVSGKGLWGGSSRYYGQGRNFRRRNLDALDRFAEELSKHDIESGDEGGNVRECSRRLGLRPTQGQAMLQRIRKRLGPQAI